MKLTKRFAWILAASAAVGLQQAAAETTLVRASKVYTLDGPPLAPGAVLIVDGKIKTIAKEIAAPAGAKVVDVKGVVMPALVNAYDTSAIAGGDSEATKEMTPSYRVLPAIDWNARSLREAIAGGVGTVGVFPGADPVVGGIGCVVKTQGADAASRTVSADAGLAIAVSSDPAGRNNARGRPDSLYMRQPTNRMGVVWMLRSSMLKVKNGSAPELADLASVLSGKRTAFCTSRIASDVESSLRLGRDYGFKPVIVGGNEAYQVADQLAASKTPVILNSITTNIGNGAEGADIVWNQAGVLHKAGVVVAIAGDNLLDQIRFAVRFGLPADAALASVTTVPAKLLGVDAKVGRLAAGADADLLALSGEPLDFTSAVQWVAVGGKIQTVAQPASAAPPARRPRNFRPTTTPEGMPQ